MIIGLDLFCVSDDHAASGFTTLFSEEDGRITTDASGSQPTSDQPGVHKNSQRFEQLQARKRSSAGSNKSPTNIQYNVERLISKNLKQNCVH